IYDVYQWEQSNFDDSVSIFEMLKRPDTVSVICVVDDKVLVIQDEQPHRGVRSSTLPGGRVDEEDHSTLRAAKREVEEEVGYQFKNWKLVNVLQPIHKLEWFIYTYVAWGVTAKGDVRHDPGERIASELKSFDEFKSLVI